MIDVLDGLTDFDLGIVNHETSGGTMVMSEVFKGSGHVRFRSHGVASKEMGFQSTVELEHGAATMTRDAVIMGWDLREEGVGGEPLRDVADIGSREPGLEVLAKWIVHRGMIELGGSIQGLTDAIDRNPTKIGMQQIQVWQTGVQLLGEC